MKGSLDKVLKMNGVYYNWKRSAYPGFDFPDEQQIGFIAQDMAGILPQVVSYDTEGYASVDYSRITTVVVEAIKEQQCLIQKLEKELELKNKQITNLSERLSALESFILKDTR